MSRRGQRPGPGEVPLEPRDRRAERIRAHRGRASADQPRSVVVIGGGIAGLTAAVALAERGVQVTLVEAEAELGGRVRSWPVGEDRSMSRGFHAFFRQYYNLRSLLRRVDPQLHQLVPVADYPLRTASGVTDSFASIPRTPPFNLAGFVWQSPTFPLTALPRVDLPTALELIRVRFPDTFHDYDDESAAEFLDRLRFPPDARHLALEVFARSFFADPEQFSARELVTMFHTYFTGSAEGLLFDVPREAYTEALWAPLGEYLERRGGRVRTETAVAALERSDQGWTVTLRRASLVPGSGAETMTADAVVLAADPRAARHLLAETTGARLAPGGMESEAWTTLQSRAQARRNAPPFAVLRLWLDAPVAADRPAFLGTSNFGPLDNVTVLERYEDSARRWSLDHAGSVVELHAYAVPEAVMHDAAAAHRLRDSLLTELHRVYPETRVAGILAEEFLIEDDCGLADTAPWSDQPEVATGVEGLVLAGDWIRCDYPVALMERAATTGFLAANELLARWGVTGHDLWSPPLRGILAGRRR